MANLLPIHPNNPQSRLIKQVVECLRKGGVVIYPTDTSYALACQIGDKAALDRIRQIRKLDSQHHFTLVCRTLSEVADYAKVENAAYRLIKRLTPGAYTFILKATREVPKRLMNAKRKTIGLRIQDSPILDAMLDGLREPVMSTTLIMPGESQPLSDPDEIYTRLNKLVDIIIDGGCAGLEVTTMIDLSGDEPIVLREGKGEVANIS